MDGQARRTRFETRISIERDFLGRVNSVFGASAPLAGMTIDAINSWASRASQQWGEVTEIANIARILLEASERSSLLADNSRDVFEEDRRPSDESMAELQLLLEHELENAVLD